LKSPEPFPSAKRKSMTEAEWNTCTEPKLMLEYLRGKASARKLRRAIR
jgi:hypothetical protein